MFEPFLYIDTIRLPRQALDKHRKTQRRRGFLSQAPAAVFLCHEGCQDSGEVVFAEMGRFGRLAVLKGPALKMEKGARDDAALEEEGEGGLSAEWVRENWSEILGLDAVRGRKRPSCSPAAVCSSYLSQKQKSIVSPRQARDKRRAIFLFD